jgi:hypothetical protein
MDRHTNFVLEAFFMSDTTATDPASPPDPQPDRPGRTMPRRIAIFLHTVRIMLGFGRRLAETVTQRATTPDFNPIAACYGTGRLSAILAHLQRGLLRAAALERVLLERAAQGRDIRFNIPGKRATATADPPAATPAPPASEQPSAPRTDLLSEQSAKASVVRKPLPPSRPHGWNDPELFMPTPKELEAQVRRRPLGRTLVDICLDLAVVPGFCASQFWNHLHDCINVTGGSVVTLMQEKTRREEAFCKEQDKKPGSNWDWQTMKRDALRRVLGLWIGEVADGAFDPLAELYAPAVAAAPEPS